MQLSDFDYELPKELIAQFPLPSRSSSRLLIVRQDNISSNPSFQDAYFKDIVHHLKKGDLLIFNDTKVIPARIHGFKPTGGKVEVLVERVMNQTQVLCQIKASKAILPNTSLFLGNQNDPTEVTVIERQTISNAENTSLEPSPFYLLDFKSNALDTLQKIGELPLPPYIRHVADEQDQNRYQTVYAANLGAVAAPTAGLHFDEDLLNQLRNLGVEIAQLTLHVGSGTFSPVRNEDLSTHQMHYERYSIPPNTRAAIDHAQLNQRRIICVGTTSLRALESAVTLGDNGDTNLFITPGYKFKVVNALITNFHLPKSTLLMLVSAFSGFSCIKKTYQHAIDNKYRFFSYGDAMFLERAPNE
jgi:S-adenosylmethionine:tRNA ribosyltransferase-isomerase